MYRVYTFWCILTVEYYTAVKNHKYLFMYIFISTYKEKWL